MEESLKTIRVKIRQEGVSEPATRFLFYKPYALKVASAATDLSSTPSITEYAKQIIRVANIPPFLHESDIKQVFACFGKVDHVMVTGMGSRAKPTQKRLDRAMARRVEESKTSTNSNGSNSISIRKRLNKQKKQHEQVSTRVVLDRKYFNDDNYDENDSDNDEYDEKNSNEQQQTELGYKQAYVLFSQQQSIEKVKEAADNRTVTLGTCSALNNTGVKKWIEEYKERFVDAKLLQKEIDTYMEEFDKRKELELEAEQAKTDEPDEDGWTTVTSKQRKGNMPFTERNLHKIKTKETRKRKQMQLINFYKFQMNDAKKDHLVNLKKKFEEDKQRIEIMKKTRRFKPY